MRGERDMALSIPQIEGAEKLTSWFGCWPSFHDAEVVEVVLRRRDADGHPSLTAAIHVFEMTSEVSATGHFVCRHHAVVTMRFAGLSCLELEHFNHQNALCGLMIEDAAAADASTGAIRVEFSDAYGLGCEFRCTGVEVIGLEPGIPPGSVYARHAG
jgi:hypothetical protein